MSLFSIVLSQCTVKVLYCVLLLHMLSEKNHCEDDVARRLKAWCLKGMNPECITRKNHMYMTDVPPLSEVNSTEQLNLELEALECLRTNRNSIRY